MSAKETELRKTFKLRDLPGHTVMLDLRLDSGEAWGFPYAYKIFMKFDRAVGITMRFSSHTVVVKGRNLAPIYEALLIQRVEQLHAEDSRYDVGDEAEPFVESITVTEPKEREKPANASPA